jgi:hypothetical protein
MSTTSSAKNPESMVPVYNLDNETDDGKVGWDGVITITNTVEVWSEDSDPLDPNQDMGTKTTIVHVPKVESDSQASDLATGAGSSAAEQSHVPEAPDLSEVTTIGNWRDGNEGSFLGIP